LENVIDVVDVGAVNPVKPVPTGLTAAGLTTPLLVERRGKRALGIKDQV